jgi:hypothetical protein
MTPSIASILDRMSGRLWPGNLEFWESIMAVHFLLVFAAEKCRAARNHRKKLGAFATDLHPFLKYQRHRSSIHVA